MENSLRLGCCTGGVEDEEWMLAIEIFGEVLVALAINNLMPPNVALIVPGNILSSSFDDEDFLHICFAE